ncbi:hypothetical protein SODALDRAFT_271225 [Sodiomyces alkalinus F11]|uniref:tRNA-splicing endonuclease subunit Sen15 domain-containing protein n=1 Tax=Sodiomyces alkalinus (strain CBS 110278 / VKM F-3762 / F11) TaxID=1314773 RepID=A0A3N2Q075_SODAK|nr:hypothetical protein SODALDRAFT_271225 [Sodiomyces alkalinus F11]ROT40153.1 hypothetical protein SODALDRAFT_271225 [Sodiomyces alkalinus F11]
MQDRTYEHLAALVVTNLVHQHGWTEIKSHPVGGEDCTAPRRLIITGLPQRRLYIHPDEQVEALEDGYASEHQHIQEPEFEWVLPLHITESVTLGTFSTLFDSISVLPRPVESHAHQASHGDTRDWRCSARHKRCLIALLHDDSTVSYYLMHDGIVKPRQN